MQHNIHKLCADSLRTFTIDKLNIKIKAAHAHELVAAFFGYKSKNAMLADKKFPISNLDQAEVVVMIPDKIISQRRDQLKELPSDLPDNYTLGEAIYTALFSEEWWSSEYPPFRSFDKLAKFLIEKNEAYRNVFKFYRDVPMHHIVDVKTTENGVLITVIHSHKSTSGEMLGVGQTTISLPRVVGHIGYGTPKVSVEKWTGGARRKLEPWR